MKSYLFLLLISFSLFFQLINCDGEEDGENENVTISGLMEILFQKTLTKNVDLKAHLNFLVHPFSNTTYENTCAELRVNLKAFEFTVDELVEKVPKTMMFKGSNVRSLLHKEINSIISEQEARVQLNQEIHAELNFNTLNKNDQIFYDSYKQWVENSVDKLYVRTLIDKISYHIVPVYVKFMEKFHENINNVKIERQSIDSEIESINSMYNSLHFEKTNEDIEKFMQAILELASQHKMFIEILRNFKKLLKDYNNHRVLSTEFFIGLRKQFGADRTPVEPFTNVNRVQKLAKMAYKAGADNCFGACTGANAKNVAKGCAKGCFKAIAGVCAKDCMRAAKNLI